jgi:hypothetical protein
MQPRDVFEKYGEPLYCGSKHLVWRDLEQNLAIKMTRPGYLTEGTIIITSQPWREPADANCPHPSVAEMSEYMEAHGFTRLNSDNWQDPDGITARNVTPKDFIRTKHGVVAIDVDLAKPKA